MAKGSVRKKGKKWYYRYYVEDASGNLVQKECVGTESKSETEKLLRKAMEEYESKKIVAKTENITLGELLDVWVDEELKVSSLSNNTVTLYLGVVKIMKRHPLSKRKLRTVTSEHMQEYMDYLSFGGTAPDGTEAKTAKYRPYPFLFSSVTEGFPVCGVSKAVYQFQSYAVCSNQKTDAGSGFVRYGG